MWEPSTPAGEFKQDAPETEYVEKTSWEKTLRGAQPRGGSSKPKVCNDRFPASAFSSNRSASGALSSTGFPSSTSRAPANRECEDSPTPQGPLFGIQNTW